MIIAGTPIDPARHAALEAFAAAVKAELDEPGHITKDEIRALLDQLEGPTP